MKSFYCVFISLAPVLMVINGHASTACIHDLSLNHLHGLVTLPSGCTIHGALQIVASNTVLDCQGSVIDGEGIKPIGLVIAGNDRSLDNVHVQNCTFRNFTQEGIRIEFKGRKTGIAETYAVAARDILIANTTIENAGNIGVYIGPYSNGVTLIHSRIYGSRGPAVYLSYSSRNNYLIGNRLESNGFDKTGRRRREAVAIDSSAQNIIRSNKFVSNGLGGVFLYKNCGEHYSTGRSPLRWQHSSNNQLINNEFFDERIGVWVASRQSRNLKGWDCGDKSMDPEGNYFEDFSNSNTVSENTFCAVDTGIRIEGDHNIIRQNRFDTDTKTSVETPSTKRLEFLGRPPAFNIVTGNTKIPRCAIQNQN